MNLYGGHDGPLWSWDGGDELMVNYICTICGRFGVTINPEDDPRRMFIVRRCPGCEKDTEMRRQR